MLPAILAATAFALAEIAIMLWLIKGQKRDRDKLIAAIIDAYKD